MRLEFRARFEQYAAEPVLAARVLAGQKVPLRGEPGQVRAWHPGELGARKRERADVADLVDDDHHARILRVEPVDGVLPVGNGCV